jgi:hypothetical protein
VNAEIKGASVAKQMTSKQSYLFSYIEILTLLLVVMLANATVDQKKSKPFGDIELAATVERVKAMPTSSDADVKAASKVFVFRFRQQNKNGSIENEVFEIADIKAQRVLRTLTVNGLRNVIGTYLPTSNPKDRLYFAGTKGESAALMPFVTAYAIAVEACQKKPGECSLSKLGFLVELEKAGL